MLYIERDGEGKIIALHRSPTANASEETSIMDKEVLDFVHSSADADSRKMLLSLSDMEIIRLLEDLIDLLVQKNIIIFTELPEAAREKIQERKRLRETFTSQTLTVDDIL
jgi:hypothetical protein